MNDTENLIVMEIDGKAIPSTPHIKPELSYGFSNIVDIENITRTWFQLMIRLNESPRIRDFFATENYIDGEWVIEPTPHTRDFLTSGLVIYEVINKETDKPAKHLIINKHSSEEEFTTIHKEYFSNPLYDVVALFRWPGCSMVIPENLKLQLDPNIVWPSLTFDTTLENDETLTINIENSANKITWTENQGQGNLEQATISVKDKNRQGQAKGQFNIPGKVNMETATLTLPYTCASFDILTKIQLGDSNDELVIFTS